MEKTLWFVAVLLPDEAVAAVRRVQQEIAETCGPRRAMRLVPHITIEPPFRLADSQTPRLLETLERFFSSQPQFDLVLKDFGYFRDDVIFVQVAPCLELLELHARLSNYLRNDSGIISGPPMREGYTPHLTLANRDVTPRQHAAILRLLSGRRFHAAFSVHEICLMRHNQDSWDIAKRYPCL